MTITDIASSDHNHLRRISLAAQGLLQTKPFGSGIDGTLQTIKHLSYVQIDSISVIERAHHHVLFSRVPNYQPDMLNKLLLSGDIFEYWSHAAAVLPIDDFRFSLPYKQALKSGQTHWYKNPDKKLMKELLARIQIDGPLRSRDLEANKENKSGWWDWKPAKKALEQLYMEGELMICNREGFQKTYDLTERVLPECVNTTLPSIEDFAAHILEQQLRCHGIVSLKGLLYLRRNSQLRKTMKEMLATKVTEHTLEQIRLHTGEIYYGTTGLLEPPLPRASSKINNRMLLLSPFDNSLIQRERLKSIFNFDYQLECYVPAEKRQYGYFSLPLLFRNEFIGRADCKAHRKTSTLEVKALHFEKHSFDDDLLIAALARAVKDFSHFQQCTTLTLTTTNPKKFKKPLLSALESLDK